MRSHKGKQSRSRRDKLALGEPEVRQLLLLMDADKNGKISKEEWMKFMEAEFDRLDKDRKGELTHVVNEATYLLPDQATNDCGLSIAGMNGKGTEIYDYEFCGTHEGQDSFYHERTVDPQTWALGAPQQIFAWSVDSIGNPDSVQLIKGLLFAFAYPVAYQPYNELQVYPITTNKKAKPRIDCTSTMLAACGSDTGVAHPSAKYVFYTNAQNNTTEVDAVDLSSKQIVSTGTMFSTLTPNILEFSPDGWVVCSWERPASTISIFGFNASTAAITTGGSVTEASTISILPAERR